jgi:hypothetical protein
MAFEKINTNVALATNAVLAKDIDVLKTMGNRKSDENPIRVHQGKDGDLIVAIGGFAVENETPGSRFGISAELVSIMTKAAEDGSFYLEISKDGPAVPTTKPFVDLSTGHLRLMDYHILEDLTGSNVPAPLKVYGHGYGWIIDVKSAGTDDELKEAGLSDGIISIIKSAREAGADILDFDRDADLDPGFPEFDAVTDELVKPEEDAPSVPGM